MDNVKVEFDFQKATNRIKEATKKGQLIMAMQALKDCNRYVKKDSGDLEASSIKASRLDIGKLVWDKPYAKKQYYTGTPNKDVNPLASKLWAHKAESVHGNEWMAMLQKVIDKEV